MTKERFFIVSVDVMIYARSEAQARDRVERQLLANSPVEQYEDWPKFTNVQEMSWNEHHFKWEPEGGDG